MKPLRSISLDLSGVGRSLLEDSPHGLRLSPQNLNTSRLRLVENRIRPPSAQELVRKHKDDLSEIVPHIFLSSALVASNSERLKRAGVTHVVNVASSACTTGDGFEVLNMAMHDDSGQDITACLPVALSFIDAAIASGGGVLVHCVQGVSRSTSIVLAYLIWKLKYTFAGALAKIRMVRPSASPNPAFTAQLIVWERRLAAPLTVTAVRPLTRLSPDDASFVPRFPLRVSRSSALDLYSDRVSIIVIPEGQYIFIGAQLPPDAAAAPCVAERLVAQLGAVERCGPLLGILREVDIRQFDGRSVRDIPDPWPVVLGRLGIPGHVFVRYRAGVVVLLGHHDDVDYLNRWGRRREYGEARVNTPPPVDPSLSPPRWSLLSFPRYSPVDGG